MWAFCLTFAALAWAMALAAAVEIKTLTDAASSIYFTKSGDVAVLGLFEKKGSKEHKLFQQVAEDLSHGGMVFGVSTHDDVISKYQQETGAPDADNMVIVFNPFSAETGRAKKGKKSKAYFAEDFTYAKLHEFVLRESIPVVVYLPVNEGPDTQKRNMMALQNMHPKMFMFSEKDEVPEEYLAAARSLRDRVLAFYVRTNPKLGAKKDEGSSLMASLKLDPKELKGKDHLVYMVYDKPEQYTGPLSGLQKLEDFLDDFMRGKPKYEAVAPRGRAQGKTEL